MRPEQVFHIQNVGPQAFDIKSVSEFGRQLGNGFQRLGVLDGSNGNSEAGTTFCALKMLKTGPYDVDFRVKDTMMRNFDPGGTCKWSKSNRHQQLEHLGCLDLLQSNAIEIPVKDVLGTTLDIYTEHMGDLQKGICQQLLVPGIVVDDCGQLIGSNLILRICQVLVLNLFVAYRIIIAGMLLFMFDPGGIRQDRLLWFLLAKFYHGPIESLEMEKQEEIVMQEGLDPNYIGLEHIALDINQKQLHIEAKGVIAGQKIAVEHEDTNASRAMNIGPQVMSVKLPDSKTLIPRSVADSLIGICSFITSRFGNEVGSKELNRKQTVWTNDVDVLVDTMLILSFDPGGTKSNNRRLREYRQALFAHKEDRCVAQYDARVSWVMCNTVDYWLVSRSYSTKEPTFWIGNPKCWYPNRGWKIPHGPVEDIAFAAARFQLNEFEDLHPHNDEGNSVVALNTVNVLFLVTPLLLECRLAKVWVVNMNALFEPIVGMWSFTFDPCGKWCTKQRQLECMTTYANSTHLVSFGVLCHGLECRTNGCQAFTFDPGGNRNYNTLSGSEMSINGSLHAVGFGRLTRVMGEEDVLMLSDFSDSTVVFLNGFSNGQKKIGGSLHESDFMSGETLLMNFDPGGNDYFEGTYYINVAKLADLVVSGPIHAYDDKRCPQSYVLFTRAAVINGMDLHDENVRATNDKKYSDPYNLISLSPVTIRFPADTGSRSNAVNVDYDGDRIQNIVVTWQLMERVYGMFAVERYTQKNIMALSMQVFSMTRSNIVMYPFHPGENCIRLSDGYRGYDFIITRGQVIPREAWNEDNKTNMFLMAKLTITICTCLMVEDTDGPLKRTLKLFCLVVNGLDPPMDLVSLGVSMCYTRLYHRMRSWTSFSFFSTGME